MNARFPSASERLKRETLLQLLSSGMVLLHLDTRREGVTVPPQHRGHPALPLNLSHAFRLDVFEIGPVAVEASLSFQGEVYRCVLPYDAIFSMTSRVDGQSRLFADSVPPELEEIAQDAAAQAKLGQSPAGEIDVSAAAAEYDGDDVRLREAAPGPSLRLVD